MDQKETNPISYLMDTKNLSADSLDEEEQIVKQPEEEPVVVDEGGGTNNNTNLFNGEEISQSPTIDQSFGPALVATSSFDSPAQPPAHESSVSQTNVGRTLSEDGDVVSETALTSSQTVELAASDPTLRETEEYASDLARELIDDTNVIVETRQSSEDIEKEEITTTTTTGEEKLHEAIEETPKEELSEEVKVAESEVEAGVELKENFGEELESNLSAALTVQSNLDTHRVIQLDAHHSFATAADNSLEDNNNREPIEDILEDKMEFTKNYSDDLLMGQSDLAQQGEMPPTGADLADFELPPYSGSSSGSEPRQHSPVKRKSSSSSSTATAQASSSSSINPPDLNAVKNLIISSYSRVSHVFQWKQPIETGILFAIGLTLITALSFFSIISVVAYSALGVMSTSGLIRLYKMLTKTLNRSSETPVDHIWDKVLALDVSMSSEKTHELIETSLNNLNSSLVYFKQVLLVEDKIATLKFGLFLYVLTYIGSWFNGMTLITLTYLGLFLVPILYEKNKTKIDEYIELGTRQASTAISMVTGKLGSLAFGSSPASSTSGSSKKQN